MSIYILHILSRGQKVMEMSPMSISLLHQYIYNNYYLHKIKCSKIKVFLRLIVQNEKIFDCTKIIFPTRGYYSYMKYYKDFELVDQKTKVEFSSKYLLFTLIPNLF